MSIEMVLLRNRLLCFQKGNFDIKKLDVNPHDENLWGLKIYLCQFILYCWSFFFEGRIVEVKYRERRI